MTVVLENTARNAACNAVVDLLDGGTIEFQTSGGVEVATATLGTPAFGAAVDGTATANAITSDPNPTGGVTTQAVFKTSGGAALYTVSVTEAGGGGDLVITNSTVVAGTPFPVTGYTHTQQA